MCNIILSGFMGCGKSSVGQRLSVKTGMCFVDTDIYIEETSGMKISEIFRDFGEPYFRKLETDAARILGERTCTVISTGGGMTLNPTNAQLLRKNGTIVFLDTPIEEITERLMYNSDRPLLMREDKLQYIQKLYAERRPKYIESADIIFECGNKTILQNADEIYQLIRCK